MEKIIFIKKYYKQILLTVSCLPLVLLIVTVAKYWVNVPFCDEWESSVLFDQYFDGTLSFSYLISQQNESRTLFARLIILGLGIISGYDVRWQMCVSILFACIISLNIGILIKRAACLSTVSKLLLFALLNMFVFSISQWENWIWGLQMIVFMPILMLTCGLVVNTSNMPTIIKILLTSLFSTICTFTYCNGMLVWLLLYPFSFFSPIEKKKMLLARFIYFILAVLAITYYFYGYQKPPHHPSFYVIMTKPFDAMEYFFIWLGTPFDKKHASELSVISGVLLPSIAGNLNGAGT